MKLYKLLSTLLLSAGIIACESLSKEEGNAQIYITGSINGIAEIAPEDVTIDKENKTMTYTFGIHRSGLQSAEEFTVDCRVDNSLVPEGTVPLSEGEYTLSTKDGAFHEIMEIAKGSLSKNIYLTIPEEVFLKHDGQKMAVHVSISNPSRYELNAALSTLDIVIDVNNFLGTYEDITESILKNYKSPFDVTLDSPPVGSCDPYQHTPTDWIVNDAVKIHAYQGKMYGGVDARCWGDRNWLSAGNYDFYQDKGILNGKIYQIVELTPGEYKVEYEIAEAAGGPGHAAVAVALGEKLPDFDQKDEKCLAWEEFTTSTNIKFSINDETKYALGFMYNIPKGVQGAYAIKAIKVKRQTNVFN